MTQSSGSQHRYSANVLGDALDDYGCDPLADDVELLSLDTKVPMAEISAMGTGL